MAHSGWYKIAVIGIQQSTLLTHEHLDLASQDNTALVKRVLVSRVFLALIDLHADHYHVIPNFRLAEDPGSELFQFQCAQVPESHGFLLFADRGSGRTNEGRCGPQGYVDLISALTS
jgi:hypothetical protein